MQATPKALESQCVRWAHLALCSARAAPPSPISLELASGAAREPALAARHGRPEPADSAPRLVASRRASDRGASAPDSARAGRADHPRRDRDLGAGALLSRPDHRRPPEEARVSGPKAPLLRRPRRASLASPRASPAQARSTSGEAVGDAQRDDREGRKRCTTGRHPPRRRRQPGLAENARELVAYRNDASRSSPSIRCKRNRSAGPKLAATSRSLPR